jgi:hypothetical protein
MASASNDLQHFFLPGSWVKAVEGIMAKDQGTKATGRRAKIVSESAKAGSLGPETKVQAPEPGDQIAESCRAHFGNDDMVKRVKEVMRIVAQIHQNTSDQQIGRLRRKQLQVLHGRFEKLEQALEAVDLAFLLYPIDYSVSPEQEASEPDGTKDVTAPRRLRTHLEFFSFVEQLKAQKANCENAIRRLKVKPKGGAPERVEPLQFGVECLANIWEVTRGAPPTMSFKKGGFGDFALLLLGKPRGLFPGKSVRGAVTKFCADQKPTSRSRERSIPADDQKS